MDELGVLQRVDLQWTMHVDRIWRDADYHVPGFHEDIRNAALQNVDALAAQSEPHSPLGMVLTGEAGAGKTHLLSSIRDACAARGVYFVLVDMTDVRDFWETVLLGYLKSLMQPGGSGDEQCREVLRGLPGASTDAGALIDELPPGLITKTTKLIEEVSGASDMQRGLEHRDVLRALVLYASSEMQLRALGFDWLQATGISDEQELLHGFRHSEPRPTDVVRGLSWLMSLSGPTVLALDQLDAIVAEHNTVTGLDTADMDPKLAQRVHLSQSIIEGIGRGLMELRDMTSRTLTVVSSLQATWDILKQTSGQAAADRFEGAYNLRPSGSGELPRQIIERRLRASFREAGFEAPYPSWPFRPEAFEGIEGWTPRTVLKRCDAHRRACLAEGRVRELASFLVEEEAKGPEGQGDAVDALDREYQELAAQADVAHLLDETQEDALGDLVGEVLHFATEAYALPDALDVSVEDHIRGRKAFDPLHARLRVVDHRQNDREEHLSVRVLERTHHLAFQARLRAAITEAGIDEGIAFRKLIVLRHTPEPQGKVSQQLVSRLRSRGGELSFFSEPDVRKMWALSELNKNARPGWYEWLKRRRPVGEIDALRGIADWLGELLERKRPGSTKPPEPRPGKQPDSPSGGTATGAFENPQAPVAEGSESVAEHAHPRPLDAQTLPAGTRVMGGQNTKAPVSLDLPSLTKHVAVLAGAGSGKTVFVRRLVEEAALRKIPAVVVDVANDLSMLGERWPERPDGFSDDDAALAERYQEETAVRVYTPGRESGHPVVLRPLPDFAAVRGDGEALNEAVQMAADSLRPIVVGRGQTADVKEAILKESLRFFATSGSGGLQDYIEFLAELPADLVPGFEKAERHARNMSESLRAKTINDPLFKTAGTPLDPAVLFERPAHGKTPISVFNLAGLGTLENQQNFVNQLAMTLFTWVKDHPLAGETGLGGLFVIDEAKDFVPANKTTVCSQSILRGAAQFRKYGVGMIVATQEPKSIDHRIVANCTTQVYGRANSPAAIQVVKDLISQRGGAGDDVARLKTGQFHVYGEGFDRPIKVAAPLCLSHHPKNPPSADWIAERARESR